mmetsp:Transcript_26187/g.67712  ORF Transcript_26187/g.67712 Transcript_26187/m.67712 type:complete len:317 (-) Transcript_26187:151-1101(-)
MLIHIGWKYGAHACWRPLSVAPSSSWMRCTNSVYRRQRPRSLTWWMFIIISPIASRSSLSKRKGYCTCCARSSAFPNADEESTQVVPETRPCSEDALAKDRKASLLSEKMAYFLLLSVNASLTSARTASTAYCQRSLPETLSYCRESCRRQRKWKYLHMMNMVLITAASVLSLKLVSKNPLGCRMSLMRSRNACAATSRGPASSRRASSSRRVRSISAFLASRPASRFVCSLRRTRPRTLRPRSATNPTLPTAFLIPAILLRKAAKGFSGPSDPIDSAKRLGLAASSSWSSSSSSSRKTGRMPSTLIAAIAPLRRG